MNSETKKYTLPSYLADYLINGNKDNINTNELEEFEEWIDRELGQYKGHWTLEDQEEYFSWCNDFNNIGGNCIDITFVIMNSEPKKINQRKWINIKDQKPKNYSYAVCQDEEGNLYLCKYGLINAYYSEDGSIEQWGFECKYTGKHIESNMYYPVPKLHE